MKKIILCLWVVAALPGPARATLPPDAVVFREMNADAPTRLLGVERQPAVVDINSQISIEISTGLLSTLSPATTANPALSEKEAQVGQLVVALNQWADALNQAWQYSDKLATTPKDDPQYSVISRKAGGAFRKFYNGFSSYAQAVQALPDGPARAAALRAKANDALGLSKAEGNPIILNLFKQEIVWMNSQIQELSLAIAKAGIPLAIKITAFHARGGTQTPLHLPGYDSMDAGVPEPYQKIRFEPAPADLEAMAKINADAADLADTLNKAKSSQEKLRVIGRQILGQNFDDVQRSAAELRAAVDAAVAVNWSERGGAAAKSLEAQLKNQGISDYRALISSASALSDLQVSIADSVKGVKDSMRILDQTLSTANSNDPATALPILMSVPGKATAVLGALDGLQKLKTLLPALEADIKMQAASMPPQLKNIVSDALANASVSEIKNLIDAATDFKTRVAALADRMKSIGHDVLGNAAEASSVDLPEVTSAHVVALGQAGPTTLDLMTAHGRREGDRIVVRVQLYQTNQGADGTSKPETKPLDERTVSLEMLRHGFYSRPGGGLVFVSRVGQTPAGAQDVRGQAGPVVSWALQHRAWPKGNEGRKPVLEALRPALGAHTTALRFSNGGGTEIGVGVSLSFVDDLFQTGYGWNLNVSSGQQYWFVGVRAVHFGQGSGVK